MFLANIIADEVTPVTQGITFAVVGGVFTVVTLIITNRSKTSSEKMAEAARAAEDARQTAKEERDYARQDLVAERLEKATQQTMSKLNDVEELGKVTHALVNSDKTSAMKDQLDGWRATLALMSEVISLKKESGRDPTEESMSAIAALKTRIQTLEESINERLAQQLAAEQRIEIDKAQAGAQLDAADRQLAAAEAQQAAADSQQAVADQIAATLHNER